MKLEIIGKIDSILGFSRNKANKGERCDVQTQGSYFSQNDLADPNILAIRDQIHNIMSTYIFPLFLYTFSSKNLPKQFVINAVRIELFSDSTKNIITFNTDTKLFGEYEQVKKQTLKQGDLVYQKDIKNIRSLYVKDRDPNSAIMLFTSLHGEWYGIIDLIYNRENVLKKYNLAQEHLEAAKISLQNLKFGPYYNELWSAYELFIESILLLHNIIKLQATHKTISSSFIQFCITNNLSFFKTYEEMKKNRNAARYGPPYKINIKKADLHLENSIKFSNYVNLFLKIRQINLGKSKNLSIKQSHIIND